MKKNILMFDDDQLYLDIVEIVCSDMGLTDFKSFSDPVEGMRHFHKKRPGYYGGVIMDLVMPGKNDGIRNARKIRKLSPHMPVFFLSAYKKCESPNIIAEINSMGNTFYLEKPFKPAELINCMWEFFGGRNVA